MTAKEMFEELDYRFFIDKENYIEYTNNKGYLAFGFCKIIIKVKIYNSFPNGKEIKAMAKQVEELGWV